MARTIREIAQEIHCEWPNCHFTAYPYLQAMLELKTVDDVYGVESGRDIVAYFLSNALSFRGEAARRLKKELKDLLK